MRKIATTTASIAVVISCLLGCAGPTDVAPPSTASTAPDVPPASSSTSTAPEITTSSSPEVEADGGEAAFVWRPDLGREYGSDVANRSPNARGLIDGQGGRLYFRARSGRESAYRSLCTLNEATGEIEELAADCGGMINVIGDAVFYIGDAIPGVFRYDIRTKRVSREYEGGVLNLLATEKYLYIVNVNLAEEECELYELNLASGELSLVATDVSEFSCLQYSDGYVYFAQRDPDESNCKICRIAVGSPGQVDTVCEGIGYPVKMLGTRLLYCTNTDIRLIDIHSGEDTELYRWDLGEGVNGGPPAANGNGVFYVAMDTDGYAELRVFDLESERTSTLMPVHGGAVCFVDGEIYLVHVISLSIERVILDANDPRTEMVVRGDPQAR